MRNEGIIINEAQEFYKFGDWRGNQTFPTVQDLSDALKSELRNHQIDGQIIYLEEFIRLVNTDAQEHLKTCKKKDKPNECPTYQFYAKSKYYAEQVMDSIAYQNESCNAKYQLNKNLSEETLSVLEDFMNGKDYPLTDDSPKEIYTVIEQLTNLGFLKKVTKHGYAMDHGSRKHLVKLLELRSWEKFINLLDDEEKNKFPSSITNNIYNSNVGQINQASAGSTINNVKTQEFSKTSWLNKLYWIIGIIVSLITVYEFFIKQFIK